MWDTFKLRLNQQEINFVFGSKFAEIFITENRKIGAELLLHPASQSSESEISKLLTTSTHDSHCKCQVAISELLFYVQLAILSS
jgi:hypothetical protein